MSGPLVEHSAQKEQELEKVCVLRPSAQKTEVQIFNRQQEAQLQSQIEAYRVLTRSQGHIVSFSPEPELLTSHAP